MSSRQPYLALLSNFHALKKLSIRWGGWCWIMCFGRAWGFLFQSTLCKLVFCYFGVGVVKFGMDGVTKLVTTSELGQCSLLPEKRSHVSKARSSADPEKQI